MESNSSTIIIDNYSFIKTADVYATQIEQKAVGTHYHSSFGIINDQNSGSLAFELTSPNKLIHEGDYIMHAENSGAAITYQSNGSTWSSHLGHQKGSTFKVLNTKELEAASGYVKEATIQVNCYLYNDRGDYIPFNCITQIKF